MKKITWEGKTFIKGLHKQPASYPTTDRNEWYWLEGSKWDENRFLPAYIEEELNVVKD